MNREELRAKAAPKTKVVSIPEWDSDLRIRQLSAAQIVNQSGDEKTSLARGAIASIVDDSGAPVYSDTPEDIAEVLQFSFAGLVRLNEEISDFNRANKSLEEIVKN